MLSAIAGPDPRSPIAIAEPGSPFRRPLERDFKGLRVAWSRDFGELPIDSRVTAVIDSQRHVFESLGCVVEDGQPDFSGADEVNKVWRAWLAELRYDELLKAHRGRIKETVVRNIEDGMKLTGPQFGRAEVKRTELYHRVREFMETYEFMVFPTCQVPPFDVTEEYVTEINGVKMESYVDFVKATYYITTVGLPAISVPCGFTPEGLPVGVQIVGRHQDDFGVLQLAHAFEQATGFWKRRPPVVE
jgi:amidase